ncbi:hypothetical protein ACH4ZX_35275 [Streptomyces sp. NPDC020490]|uniref:hypothetical protein n=1 Tax=Streptomyces sp. NPDC020490 TaxID=3365078 RepID=UPI0037947B12
MRSTNTHPRVRRAAAVAVAVLGAALITAPATSTAAASSPCTSKWTAVQRIAVRKPAWNEGAVATTHSPIVRHLRRGETVTSCIVAVGRGGWSEYHECGGGSLWRIVPGGQVPAGCLTRSAKS